MMRYPKRRMHPKAFHEYRVRKEFAEESLEKNLGVFGRLIVEQRPALEHEPARAPVLGGQATPAQLDEPPVAVGVRDGLAGRVDVEGPGRAARDGAAEGAAGQVEGLARGLASHRSDVLRSESVEEEGKGERRGGGGGGGD